MVLTLYTLTYPIATMPRIFILPAFLLAASLALAVLCAAPPAWATTFEGVTWIRCYDDDTSTFTLPGVHPFFGEKISVRIRGIDTPEIRGKCEAEKRKAKAARDYLRNLLRKVEGGDVPLRYAVSYRSRPAQITRPMRVISASSC